MSKKTIPVSKTCPVCKACFLACPPGKASRSYPPNDQVFCCRSCANHARYRTASTCKELTPAEAAYIAGFLDADGSIFAFWRRDKATIRVNFTNRDTKVLQWISDTTGLGATIRAKRRKPEKNHCLASCLQVHSGSAASLLHQIRPYLIVKGRQADLAISIDDRLHAPALSAVRTWQEQAVAQMRELNRRGPNHPLYNLAQM